LPFPGKTVTFLQAFMPAMANWLFMRSNRYVKSIVFALLIEAIIFLPLLAVIFIYESSLRTAIPDKNLFYAIVICALYLILFVAILLKKDKYRIMYPKRKRAFVLPAVLVGIITIVQAAILLLFNIKLYGITDVNIWVVSPIGEELLFRLFIFYIVYRFLDKNRFKNPALGTIIITSIQFGFFHILNIFISSYPLYFIAGQVLFAACAGAYFGFLRYKSGTILVPICAHIIFNFMPVLIGLFPITR
jgi:membrane protease YdiL (CAAX protease family)